MTTILDEIKPSNLLATDQDERYSSIPLCINDIISICKDFSHLGFQIQNQIDNILEIGIEEAINNGSVKQISLPHIKFFLCRICDNPYFGDASLRAQDCLTLIKQYEDKYQVRYTSTSN